MTHVFSFVSQHWQLVRGALEDGRILLASDALQLSDGPQLLAIPVSVPLWGTEAGIVGADLRIYIVQRGLIVVIIVESSMTFLTTVKLLEVMNSLGALFVVHLESALPLDSLLFD